MALVTGTPKTLNKVQQNVKESTDINDMVARANRNKFAMNTIATGIGQSGVRPVFGAYPSQDYAEMVNHVMDVTQEFKRLPARIRNRFMNDPLQAVRFVEDPRNLEDAVKIGLCTIPEGYEFKGGKLVEQQVLPLDDKKPSTEPPKAPEAKADGKAA